MAEVIKYMDDIIKQFNDKIKEIYDKKLEEHQNNISYNLSDGYEKDYGLIKTEFDMYITKNRYAIHKIEFSDRSNISMFIFDNYGDYYTHQNGHKTLEYIACGEIHYILPNILIDMIKGFEIVYPSYPRFADTSPNKSILCLVYKNFLKNIKKIAEDYYNRFTRYKSLYEPGKLINYNELLEQNEKLKKDIQEKDKLFEQNEKLNKDILEKDELLKQNEKLNKDILEQNEKLTQYILEKDETIKTLQLLLDDKNEIIILSRKKKKIEERIEDIQYYIKNNTKKNRLIRLNKKYNKLTSKLEDIDIELDRLKDKYDIYSSSSEEETETEEEKDIDIKKNK